MTANRTITELYQALRPLLLRDVAIAASGSRASSGGMETHALNSNWHTGQLAETQAPWAATKNEWATALATHAALPDVHHAAVTAGTLISLSGQQVGIAAGAPALPGWLPVGVWVHLDDVLLTGVWAGLSPLFVERASYQPGKGWTLESENQQGLDDLLGVLQG